MGNEPLNVHPKPVEIEKQNEERAELENIEGNQGSPLEAQRSVEVSLQRAAHLTSDTAKCSGRHYTDILTYLTSTEQNECEREEVERHASDTISPLNKCISNDGSTGNLLYTTQSGATFNDRMLETYSPTSNLQVLCIKNE